MIATDLANLANLASLAALGRLDESAAQPTPVNFSPGKPSRAPFGRPNKSRENDARNQIWPFPLTFITIVAPLPLVFPRAFVDNVLWPILTIQP